MNSSYNCYLNQSHAPTVKLLTKLLKIQLYNEKLFDTPPKTLYPSFKHDHTKLSFPPDVTTLFPGLSRLHKETNIFSPQPFLEILDIEDSFLLTLAALHKSLLSSDVYFYSIYPQGYT